MHIEKIIPTMTFMNHDSSSSRSQSSSSTKRQRKNYYVKKVTKWTKEEDDQLMLLVDLHGVQKFRHIAKEMGKTLLKCHQRYYQLIGETEFDNNRRWTPEEDAILT